jgi:hypothetical protein
MARIIKLTESDLTRIIKRVIMEQKTNFVTDMKKKYVGSKFCFNKSVEDSENKINDINHTKLYKIKSGDTFNGLMGKLSINNKSTFKKQNKECGDIEKLLPLNGVVIYSNRESM